MQGNNGNASRRAVVVVPADAEGLSRKPFWSSNVLRGAESEELLLTDVRITDEQLFFPEVEESLDAVEAGGFSGSSCSWRPLISASPPAWSSASSPGARRRKRTHAIGH